MIIGNWTGLTKTDNVKKASYGRIKETTIGGVFMHREYRHIKQYEKEILG